MAEDYVVTLRFRDNEIVAEFPTHEQKIHAADELTVRWEGDFGPSGWTLFVTRFGADIEAIKASVKHLLEGAN